MKIDAILKGAVPVVAGIVITGLIFRFFGDAPVVREARIGFG